jgi:hypothetical protein
MFDPDEVITEYSIREAIEMGALVEVFKDRWSELSGGKPIVASMNVYEEVSQKDLVEIWNRFVFWRKFIMLKLVEKERWFSTEVGVSTIWIFDDRVCFTILYPEDY